MDHCRWIERPATGNGNQRKLEVNERERVIAGRTRAIIHALLSETRFNRTWRVNFRPRPAFAVLICPGLLARFIIL